MRRLLRATVQDKPRVDLDSQSDSPNRSQFGRGPSRPRLRPIITRGDCPKFKPNSQLLASFTSSFLGHLDPSILNADRLLRQSA